MAAALEGALHAGCPALNLASRPPHDPATPLFLITLWKPVALLAFAAWRVACIQPGGALHRPKTGQVTYTDGKCAAGTTGHEVEAKRSAEEIEQDRKAARAGHELKQQRLQTEKAAADLQAQREAEQERVRAAEQPPLRRNPRTTHALRKCAFTQNLNLFPAPVSGNTYDQEPRLEAAQRQMDLDCLGHRVTPSWSAPAPRSRASSWPCHGSRVYPPLFRKNRTSRTAATFTAWTTPAPATHARGQGAFRQRRRVPLQRRSGPC